MADQPKVAPVLDPDVTTWLGKVADYEREFSKWEWRSEKVIKRYRDERAQSSKSTGAKFNVLWSNVRTLCASTFSRMPRPDVSRRFKDSDPVGRVAALLLERALDFEITHYPDYKQTLRQAVLDRFLPGRAVAWARYEPHTRAPGAEDGLEVTEDVETENPEESAEVLDYECAPVDYVHWRDFGHVVARTWEEVPAVWRKVYLTRPAAVERFGQEIGESLPLDARPESEKKKMQSDGGTQARSLVFEIWDKESGDAIWLSKSLGKIIDRRTPGPAPEDLPEFEGFFPCPRPMFATLTNDSLVPVPDFCLYQDQANELDTLCERIDGLIGALQVKGVYDADFESLSRLFTEGGNNDLIPVKNWKAFAEKNGLSGAIDLVDLAPIASALLAAYQAFEQVKGQVYEITGIADIVRGDTNPNETLGAQQLKGQFASLPLRVNQEQVAQFATELLHLKAQIMASKFSDQTLLEISGAQQLMPQDQQYVQPAIQLLRNKPVRNFRIEIATDTLVQVNEQEEKASRMEFLTGVGGFLKQAGEIGMQSPPMVPLLMELLKFGVQGFRVGKTIEGAFDETLEQLKQAASQPKPPPPPDPKLEAAKIDAQVKQATAPIQMQTEQIKAGAAQTSAQAEVIKSNNELARANLVAQQPVIPGMPQ